MVASTQVLLTRQIEFQLAGFVVFFACFVQQTACNSRPNSKEQELEVDFLKHVIKISSHGHIIEPFADRNDSFVYQSDDNDEDRVSWLPPDQVNWLN